MCINTTLRRNMRYFANKKNNGQPPERKNALTAVVPISCGMCYECKRKKGREWAIRLQEEIKAQKEKWFITLTFNNEKYKHFHNFTPNHNNAYNKENAICAKAVDEFLNRWRRKHKKNPKHWFITELGGGRYEHVHIHGIIICTKEQIETLSERWENGYVYIGNECSTRTANYITKYITKEDKLHKTYKPIILSSAKIGEAYIHTERAKKDKQNGYYTTTQGKKLPIPEYYGRLLYTDEERENEWIKKLESGEMYIGGTKVKDDDYNGKLKAKDKANTKNQRLGFINKDDIATTKAKEIARRKLLKEAIVTGKQPCIS